MSASTPATTPPATAPPPPDAPPRRRWTRRLGWSFAGLLLVLLITPVASWLWLTSSAGGRFVRHRVVTMANEALAGRVEIDSLSISGLLRLELEGLRLFAPGEDEPTLRVGRIVADVRGTSLIARRIEVRELSLLEPVVRMVDGPEGDSLSRALAPRQPTGSAPPETTETGSPPNFTIHAPNVWLRDGRVEVVGEDHFRLNPIDLKVTIEGTPIDLLARLALDVGVEAPVERSARLETELRYLGDRVKVDQLHFTSGESILDLTASGRLDGASAQARIERLLIAASDVVEFAPDAGLLGAITFAGDVSLENGRVRSDSTLTLPAGTLEVEANATLPANSRPLEYQLTLRGKELQPQRILRDLPVADLRFEATYQGTGLPPENTGTLRLDASGSQYEKLRLDTVSLEAAVEGLAAQIERLEVRTAGVRARVAGKASADAVDLKAFVAVPDLARTRRALQQGLGLELPELGGALTLDADVRGEPSEPRIGLRLHVPELTTDGARMEEVRFRMSASRLLPMPRGTIALEAGTIEAGELKAEQLELTGSIDGQNVRTDMTGKLADTPVELKVRGQRQPSRRAGTERWRFDALEGRALGVSVHSRNAMHIEVGNERARVEDLVLGGTLGRLAIDADVGASGPVEGRISVRSFHLDKLPAQLLPPDLLPGGVVEMDVSLAGTMETPKVDAVVRLQNGRIARLAPLGVELETKLDNWRLTGRLVSALPNAGMISGRWELPLEAARQRNRPVQATIRVEGLDLSLARIFVPDTPELAGRLSGEIELSGTLAQPEASLQALVSGLAVDRLDALSVVLDASYAKGKALALARVDRPRALGAEVRVEADVDVAAIVDGKPFDVEALPLHVEFDLDRLDLRWLAARELAPEDLRGIAAGALALRGSLRAPEAEALIAVRDLETAGQRISEVTATLHAAQDLVLRVRSMLDGQPWAEAEARLEATLARLLDGDTDALLDLPLTLHAVVPPTALSRLQAPGTAVDVDGALSAELTMSGTPNIPELSLQARVTDLVSETTRLGRFDAELDYRDARTLFEARYTSSREGALRAAGELRAPLGASELMGDGLDRLETRPLALLVEAVDFDLSAFNGLVPSIRDLGGRLDLHLARNGPLKDVAAQGRVTVKNARANLIEYGTASEVTLDAELDLPGFRLKQFSGRFGSGRFSASAEAAPIEGGMRGSLNVELTEVPLVQNFQTRGFLGLDLAASGTLKGDVLDIPELRISKGLLKIPERLQKSVQSLDPHPDVVFSEDIALDGSEDSGLAYRGRVKVVIPDDFRVEAPLGTNLVFGANLDVVLDPALATDDRPPLDVTGNARIARGAINLLDRRFQVDEGRIQFFSRNFQDPSLAIKAHYRGDEATVNVDISGTAQAPVTNFSSTPAMDPAEIFFYLATGQRQTRAQTETVGIGERALDTGLSLAGSAVAGVAKVAIQKVLPKELEPDVLAVETDVARMNVRTRAGKYVTNRLYIGGQYNPGADPRRWENLVELEMQYRLNESNFIQLRGGEGRSQFEFLFQRNIPAPSQRKAKVAR